MPRSRQRGAATLVVVMVLFFIISMVAAYTSRSMIFEQRTGANLYRASQSLEAAEAGMEWALNMLNGGRITATCAPSTASTDNTFRERYLDIAPVTGLIAARTRSTGEQLMPTCVFNPGTGTWNCSCPVDAAPSVSVPAGTGVAPAFRVRFRVPQTNFVSPLQPGIVRIDVVGCTRLDDNCLSINSQGLANEGRTVLGTVAMLSGRAIALPQAALTARGNVNANGMNVANVRVSDSGVTVHASGAIDTSGLSLTTIAGNALGGSTLPNDAAINLPDLAPFTAAERFFAASFLLPPQRWQQMPAVVTLDCSSGCSAADVRDAIDDNPGRPLWLNGDLDIDTSGDIGTATAPVLMVINGDLSFTTAGVTIHGLVMLRPPGPSPTWAPTGNGRIRGAIVVDGAVSGTSTLAIEYDGQVLRAMQATVGNFARVPGSWRDWTMP